jgi:hypothetical protein
VSATKVPLYGLAFSVGYLVGAAIMILGGVVELLGINAEGESLEDVTKPLTAADQTSTVRPAPATTAAEA